MPENTIEQPGKSEVKILASGTINAARDPVKIFPALFCEFLLGIFAAGYLKYDTLS